jgi:hypothetical protein
MLGVVQDNFLQLALGGRIAAQIKQSGGGMVKHVRPVDAGRGFVRQGLDVAGIAFELSGLNPLQPIVAKLRQTHSSGVMNVVPVDRNQAGQVFINRTTGCLPFPGQGANERLAETIDLALQILRSIGSGSFFRDDKERTLIAESAILRHVKWPRAD